MRSIDEVHVINYVKNTMSYLDDVSNEKEAYEVLHRTKGQLEMLARSEILTRDEVDELYRIFDDKRGKCAARLGVK